MAMINSAIQTHERGRSPERNNNQQPQDPQRYDIAAEDVEDEGEDYDYEGYDEAYEDFAGNGDDMGGGAGNGTDPHNAAAPGIELP
eukprot:11126477-Heterocapsa_arctica.AAC.1